MPGLVVALRHDGELGALVREAIVRRLDRRCAADAVVVGTGSRRSWPVSMRSGCL
ncbi:hypothetical protein GCM10029964_097340 [Kibdelosporangium lantanae]